MNGENIYSVGVIDDRKVPFHRLILEDGTTYNSYLLKTEKPTIIDAVDFIYSKQYLENLKNEKLACLEIRNHIAWYLKGMEKSIEIKNKVYKTSSIRDIMQILTEYKEDLK